MSTSGSRSRPKRGGHHKSNPKSTQTNQSIPLTSPKPNAGVAETSKSTMPDESESDNERLLYDLLPEHLVEELTPTVDKGVFENVWNYQLSQWNRQDVIRRFNYTQLKWNVGNGHTRLQTLNIADSRKDFNKWLNKCYESSKFGMHQDIMSNIALLLCIETDLAQSGTGRTKRNTTTAA